MKTGDYYFKFEIETPTLIESENPRERTHWSVRWKFRQALEWEIVVLSRVYKEAFEALLKNGSIPDWWKTEVVYTSYRRRILDEDNLMAGTKPWTDCLVSAGWAKKDDPKFFKATVKQVPVLKRSEEKTVVQVRIL